MTSTRTRRKTVDREVVVEHANNALASGVETEAKTAIFTVTSNMLLTGNAYKGFRALRESRPDVYDAWVDGHFSIFEAIRLGMVVRLL